MPSIVTRLNIHGGHLVAVALVLALMSLFITASPSHATRVHGYFAELTAEAEVPVPGPEGATGFASILIDLNSETEHPLCFELTIEGLAEADVVTAAHIHAGAAGVAGDVVVSLFTERPSGDMADCVDDVDLDLLALIGGNPSAYYVNIHTEAYPGGAVRGQLEESGVPTGPDCSVALRLDGSDAWTDHLTLRVGDRFSVRHSGRIPDMAVEQEFTQTGATEPHLFGIWVDGDGVAVDSFWFDPGDEGSWNLRAYQVVDGEEVCPVSATFEVLAAPAGSPAPTPAPALPDTAVPATSLSAPLVSVIILVAVTLTYAASRRKSR
jgi:hypothetical protein